MNRRLEHCTLSILGDSYSTFEGEVPEGNYIFYPMAEIDDVTAAKDTWWYQLIRMRDMRLLINDSSSGTTVSTSVREQHRVEDAFVMRMRRSLSALGINGEKPDCVLLFGGTNDDWLDVPLGVPQYSDWQAADLRQILPAYCCMLDYVQKNNPDAAIYAILNTDMKPDVTRGIRDVCAHYGIPCIVLDGISKKCGHPDRLGMRQIAEQVDRAMA